MKFALWKEGAVIVSIDILNMTKYESNSRAKDVALPVFAIECEAMPPIHNYLDAYEEAVLKLISLGLSKRGISKTLNASESLVERILQQLKEKQYVMRKTGQPWMLSEDGINYLDGSIRERASAESQYGYMFINAIKKEVFPFFYLGNIGEISLFKGERPPRFSLDNDENKTFSSVDAKQSILRKAYKMYFRNKGLVSRLEDGEITETEAKETFENQTEDLFADLDSLDEETEDFNTEELTQKEEIVYVKKSKLTKNMFIRALKKEPLKVYLRMRIIIDPSSPGGYRAESPFDFRGIDNAFFLKQLQWLEKSESTYLEGEKFQQFLYREIRKISPSYNNDMKDFQVFLIEKMPLLEMFKTRFSNVYEAVERIYPNYLSIETKKQNNLQNKESLVSYFAKYVVESLFNSYFRLIDSKTLEQIKQKAFDEINTFDYETYRLRICQNVGLSEDALGRLKKEYLMDILRRISTTYGNSIKEKFINMLIIDYYLSDVYIHRFLSQPNIRDKLQRIDILNRIRRKVAHDTNEGFTNKDYETYITNVFTMINELLDSFREEL